MQKFISSLSLLVPDYDEAISFFTKVMNFELIEDTDMGGGKRWVTVAPNKDAETRLLLAKASNETQAKAIGDQAGGRVFLIMNTDDFDRDYKKLKDASVTFLEDPRSEPYGKVVVFQDPFGNKWDLLQPA